ncbi:FIST signal transduction protein [Candidatus Symbiobacter mobilis]|nr:FIST N-terminal domain-containing protein [Candidatus Symbiobacter mobilis]
MVAKVLRELGVCPPNAALLFSTFGNDHATLLQELTQLLPGCPIVGGSSNGEVSREQGYRVGSSLLIVFASDTITFRAGVLRNLTFDNEAFNLETAMQQWQQQGIEIRFDKGYSPMPALGLLFPDGLGLDGGSIVRLFSDTFPTTHFFGGASAENFTLTQTKQFFNHEVLHNAVPYLLFYGPLRHHWAITEGLDSGWRAVGKRLDAQCDGKYIHTLAQKPAVDYLASRYRLQGGQLSVCHPFVIYPDRGSDVHYFRDVIGYCEATGRLESINLLPTDCQIQLTQPDPATILAVSRKNIHQALAHYPSTDTPTAALWFSCVSRALVLANDAANEFATATEAIASDLPVAGFYTYGEIAPARTTGHNTYHSSTLVTLLLGEEPLTSTGIFGQHHQFSADNLAQDNKALTQALENTRAEIQRLQDELAQCRLLNRVASHSRTEEMMKNRALALQLVCSLLDTRFADFKRLAMKGDPPKLNKLGLARLVNDLHQQQYGKPFPVMLKQLANLLTDQIDVPCHGRPSHPE